MANLAPAPDSASRVARPGVLTTLLTYLLTSGMLTCVVVGVVQLAWIIAPEWNGAYAPVLAFLVALEAATMTRYLKIHERHLPAPWYVVRAAEALVLFLMLRALLGLQRGPAYVVSVDDFYGGIDGELFVLTLLLALVWLGSGWLSSSLFDLETIDPTLDREIARDVSAAQTESRQEVIRFVLIVGAALAFFAALLNVYLRTSAVAAESYGLWHVLIYFLLGLILVSRTRLLLLRAGWTWENIPVSAGVGGHWLTYTLILLSIAMVAAVLLPTQYSLGLLGTLGYILTVIVSVVQTIFYVIAALLSALLSLFQLVPPDQPQRPLSTPRPPVFPQTPNTPMPTVSEFVQSLIFWAVFFVVVGYVAVQFLRRHPELAEMIKHLPGMSLLARGWHKVRAWFGGLSQQIEDLREARRRARAAHSARSAPAPRRFINPRRLGPRQQVQFFYLALLRRSRERGHARQPTQTPQEFASSLRSQLPEVEVDIAAITAEFSEARYSRHDIDVEHARSARRYWEHIKRALRR